VGARITIIIYADNGTKPLVTKVSSSKNIALGRIYNLQKSLSLGTM
jgi:hypothetical protein